MHWLALTLISVLFRSFLSITGKIFAERFKGSATTQSVMLLLACSFLTLFLIPVVGFGTTGLSGISWTTVLLVVLGQSVGNITYLAALKRLTSGTAQITFSSLLVFNTILSVLFMGLQLTFLNILGIMLLMTAILGVAKGSVRFEVKGVALMLLSAFLFSTFQLASIRLSQQVEIVVYLLISYLGSALFTLAVKHREVIKDLRQIKKLRNILTLPLLTAVPSLGYFMSSYYAYRVAPEPTKVAILLTSQVVLTVLLGYFFLGEKDRIKRKTVAAILVIAAAALIKG